MTRILVQRGGGASSNPRSYSSPSSSARVEPEQVSQHQLSALKDEEIGEEVVPEQVVDSGVSDYNKEEHSTNAAVNFCNEQQRSEGQNVESEKSDDDEDAHFVGLSGDLRKGLRISEVEDEVSSGDSSQIPPPPPIHGLADSNINPTRRAVVPPPLPSGSSRPPSPCRSRVEDGYNSADEHNPSTLVSSSSFSYHHHNDSGRERQFEIDIRRAKGLEVRRMLEDGNCLFRAIADQVYGDPELYDLTRQMCIDYMERERDHFSQFITEGFTSYCKRKRRAKVYGNNVEIQAFAEMYNRPIHIHSYSTEPINIFHGNYDTDSPPIRLSYHHGNHYNSLVDPRRVTVGAGLGFSSLRGTNTIDKDQVKAAIKAQQDQQIDNALLAEGRLYSDIELTEKEIERMVMAASRAEFKQQQQQLSTASICREDSSTSSAQPEPSSSSSCSGGGPSSADTNTNMVISSSSVQLLLSMGFSYMQAMESYTIFGDDVDSMLCYLLETGNTISSSSSGTSSSSRKGKATE